MRVGVDATIWPNRRGFGRYSRNLVGRLVALDRETDYVLVGDTPPPQAPKPPPGARWRTVEVSRPASGLVSSSGRRPMRDLLRLSLAARRGGFDAFVFPCIDTYYPVPGVPTVVGLYDAINDELADLMLPERGARLLWRLKQGAAVRRAAQLFTISEASRATLSRRLGIDRSRLPALLGAADPAFSPRDGGAVRRELSRLGLVGRPYLLYAGGIGPHKGLDTLLDAYAAVAASLPVPPALVVAGEFDNPDYAAVTVPVRARAAGLAPPAEARFTGWVDDEALACLHSGATVVVVPSLAEGFGLPAVEGAACGAPMVLSDVLSHRESLGEAALFFPPGDPGELRERLGRLLSDEELRARLGEKARRAAGRLSWDRSAEGLRELLRAAASG